MAGLSSTVWPPSSSKLSLLRLQDQVDWKREAPEREIHSRICSFVCSFSERQLTEQLTSGYWGDRVNQWYDRRGLTKP